MERLEKEKYILVLNFSYYKSEQNIIAENT